MKNFLYGLALLFIGLKLTGYISDWGWWTVLSPVIAVELHDFLVNFIAGWKEVKKQQISERRLIRIPKTRFDRKWEDLKDEGNG